DPVPYIDGIRINSPHYLTKIKLTSPGTHTFTLVVSQYEKQNTIHYTIRVNGQWKGHSAGGCGNFRDSYKNNPIYQFQLDKSGPLLIELRGPRQYSVGFEIVTVSTVGDPGSSGFQKKSSGDYRPNDVVNAIYTAASNVYSIEALLTLKCEFTAAEHIFQTATNHVQLISSMHIGVKDKEDPSFSYF
ncbi:hypothetical protein CIB84_007563, partial [Bambusicola thoracicus]